jgi:hypothetical protein
MTVPAKAYDVLDELAVSLDRSGVVAIKTPRRIVHEGVRILSSFS